MRKCFQELQPAPRMLGPELGILVPIIGGGASAAPPTVVAARCDGQLGKETVRR